MFFLYNFEPIYLLLAVVLSVRIILNGTNLATLVTVSLPCLLSFTFFESPFAFSPLVCFFLKDHFLSFFAWVKTFLLKLKNSLFSGKQEPEKDTVFMVKGKEEGTSIPEKSFEEALVNQAREELERAEQEYKKIITAISPERSEIAFVNQARERVEKAQEEYSRIVSQAKSSHLGEESTGIGPLTASKPFGSPDNLRYPHVGPSLNHDPLEGSSALALHKLVPRDKALSESDYSPQNSPGFGARLRHNPTSPLEETLEKNRYMVWIGCGACASILFTTTQIAWILLRKLDYTQELVKKLTDKGWPAFLFFWIRHPNPGPVGGKPLFALLVGILVGNVTVLYLLVTIVYLVS